MTTAERRVAKEAARNANKALDLLTAILVHQGGHIRIPRRVLVEAARSEVSSEMVGDSFLIWLGGPEHRP